MNIELKNIINIFTVIDGKINLLVKNNKIIEIDCLDEFDLVNSNYIKNNIEIDNINLKQYYTFSEKTENQLKLSILFIDIINFSDIHLNEMFDFFELDKLDKNNIYISKSIEYLKEKLIFNSTMKKLYPNEFILPEIQKIYENLFDKQIDRRNFRKKLIKLDIIQDLDKINSSKTGRPAKLYKFNEIKEEKILF